MMHRPSINHQDHYHNEDVEIELYYNEAHILLKKCM